MDARIVAESVSPGGSIEAIVEQDDRCAHFYLRDGTERSPEEEDSGFGLRSCWVRNLKAAPAELAVADMRQGIAPMMPAASCRHPRGAPPLDENALRIVWFEEGDAAALLEGDAVLAIIPCWSGRDGFCGYARDCAAQSPLAWPLEPGNVLLERVRTAQAYWASWDEGNPWAAVQEAGVAALHRVFGNEEKYYAIDGGEWPPRALLQFRSGDAVVLVTCGLQLRPQPTVELYVDDPTPHRCIELGLAVERRLFDLAPERIMGWLAGQSRFPWSRLSWFGHHHTMPCDSMPAGPSGRAFEAMLFARDPVGAPPVAFPPFRGDPVSLLWLVPISAAERTLAEDQGSVALARRLAERGHGFVHRDRVPVV